ncbi:MAG: potassium channel family protein [Sediminispirochaetaceae bacterium]
MDKVFAVFGLGAFGRQLCATFMEKGASVIAIDNQGELIERIKDEVTHAIRIDSTDEESLDQVPLEDVETAIVAIGDNVEASILTTALLKRKGIPYILSRAISELHMQVLRQIGADEVVNLEIDEGRRIAQRLVAPEIIDRTSLGESLSLAELKAPKSLLGKPLIKLDLRSRHRISIVVIRRTQLTVDEIGNPTRSEQAVFPTADTVLEEEDILLVVGKTDDIEEFTEL